MGLFDFLKKKPEIVEEKKLEEIRFSEIDDWISSYSKTIIQDSESGLNEIKEKIETEKTSLSGNLEILKQAELKNKNIQGRMEQIMEGNRQIYMQKVNSLLRKIEFPEKPEKVFEFSKAFDSELDKFDKGIGKSHTIMEEFFQEKASVISKSVKTIDKLVKDSRKQVEGSGIVALEDLRSKIKETQGKIKERSESEENIKTKEKGIDDLSKQITDKTSSLETLQQEQTYKEIQKEIKNKEDLEKQIIDLDSDLSHSFLEAETALKKYENLSDNKLAKKYIENPQSALLRDQALDILIIIEATKKAIESKDITLKDKKKDKVVKGLSNLNQSYLSGYLQKRSELNKTLEEAISKIKNSDILKQIRALEQELEKNEAAQEETKQSLEKMKKQLDEINVQALISNLENTINSNLKENIKLI